MNITDAQLRNYIDTIFARYDVDRSGTLDAYELSGFFNDLFQAMGYNMKITNQQAQQTLTVIDKNNDGKASKMELFLAFKQILSNSNPQNNNYGNQNPYGQQQYNQGYNQQYNQGYNQQYNQGYNQQYNQGYNQGYNQPYNQQQYQGYNQGYQQQGYNNQIYNQPQQSQGNMYQSQPNYPNNNMNQFNNGYGSYKK
jgi:hypothetical protein